MAGNEIKAGRAVVEVSLRDRVGRGLKNIERRLANTGRSIATLGGGITAGFGSVLAGLAWPTKLAADMEMTRSGFLTLTKSAEKTDSLLKQLTEAAASTPFEFPELAETARSLLAFGSSTETVVSEIKMLGDVASAINAPIGEIAELYGKARVQGRLFGEDINQLTGRGIPIIQELANQFGVTKTAVRDLVSEGQVNFSHLEKALRSMTTGAGTFAGGMARASQTITGKWSTMKDSIAAAVRPIGEALLPILGSLMEAVSKVLVPVGRWIQDNRQLAPLIAAVASAGVALGASLTALGVTVVAASSVVGGLSTLYAFGTTVVAAFGASSLAATGPVGLLTGAVASSMAVEGAYTASTVAATGATSVFGAVMTAILSPIYAVVGAVGGSTVAIFALAAAAGAGAVYIAAKIGLLSVAFHGIKIAFFELLGTARRTFGGILEALQAGRYRLAARILWAGLQLAFLQGADSVLGAFDWLWKNAWTIYQTFQVQLLKSIVNLFSRLPSLMMAALRGQANLNDILAEAMFNGFNAGGLLDKPIAAAQSRLAALRAQAAKAGKPRAAAAQREPNPAAGRQQRRPPVQNAAVFAQQRVQMAIAAAESERRRASQGARGVKPPIPRVAQSAMKSIQSKVQSVNFAPATALLTVDEPIKQTAANTKAMRQQLAHLNDKLGAGATV